MIRQVKVPTTRLQPIIRKDTAKNITEMTTEEQDIRVMTQCFYYILARVVLELISIVVVSSIVIVIVVLLLRHGVTNRYIRIKIENDLSNCEEFDVKVSEN